MITPPGVRDRQSSAIDTPLATRIQRLRLELRELEQQQRDEDDARLLRALAFSIGDCVFSAEDLIAHASIDADLRVALGCRTRPRQVGRQLSRLANRALAGRTLRCVARNGAGCIWEIAHTP